jgi:type II secretory pathway component PulF
MTDYPDFFPEMFSHIIYLSEQSGQLAEGFKKLYTHLSWSADNKQQFSKSLQYPAVVLALICVVLWMMSSVVVPQMHELIMMSGTEIPYSSLLLLNINQGLIIWAPKFVMLCVSAFFFLLGLRFLSQHHRIWQDRLLLKLPWVGSLLQKQDLAMYLHFFYVCLTSHVDLLECLEYSKKAVKNAWLQERLMACTKMVRDGTTLSKAMTDVGIFSASTIRMMQVGEVTGQLIPLLAVLESYHMRDLERQMQKFISYLQPTLLGIIGLILIWIVLGIFYPMYDQMLVLEG